MKTPNRFKLMRTPTLQYLYLQKPITMVIVICIISVLPWIGMGDFSLKGEPYETAVAVSMLETGNWVLPQAAGSETIYQPPLGQWLIAAFSLPQGHVSKFTACLPSALAFILLIGFTLVFFGKRLRFQQAFIATLLLITSLGMHRTAMQPRTDMLLAAFVVIGLFQLYRWEDQRELKGLPVGIPLLLGCAVLTQGMTRGLLLPLFVFGIYLSMLRKYSRLTLFKALLYAGISSLFLPLLWYIAAWKQGGDAFLNAMLACWGKEDGNLIVSLFILPALHLLKLLAGFAPWILFFFFSLFGCRLYKPAKSAKKILAECREYIRTMEKEKLLSLVASVCITCFYFIMDPGSYVITPAYPFIAIFLAQYALYITEYRTKVTRVFAAFMATIIAASLIIIGLSIAKVPSRIAQSQPLQAIAEHLSDLFAAHSGLTIFTFAFLLVTLATTYYQMFKKINIKILYATIALTFAAHLLIDGISQTFIY